jgi:hypothetical protein
MAAATKTGALYMECRRELKKKNGKNEKNPNVNSTFEHFIYCNAQH